MISPKPLNRAQLTLPFHAPVTAVMNEREREALKQALVQLLLEAAGVTQEGSNDGQS
jgi:hypothetical protein